jgi:hypothetical protein
MAGPWGPPVAAPASNYDIKVNDRDGSPNDTGKTVRWDAKEEHYVTVSVVEHGTVTPVDAEISIISDSPALAVEDKSPFKHLKANHQKLSTGMPISLKYAGVYVVFLSPCFSTSIRYLP